MNIFYSLSKVFRISCKKTLINYIFLTCLLTFDNLAWQDVLLKCSFKVFTQLKNYMLVAQTFNWEQFSSIIKVIIALAMVKIVNEVLSLKQRMQLELRQIHSSDWLCCNASYYYFRLVHKLKPPNWFWSS